MNPVFKILVRTLVEENKIFLWFCLCIFESDTVASDCPMRKIRKYLKI